jgi:hypothetical protein
LALAVLAVLERHQRIIRGQVEPTRHLAWLQLLLLVEALVMEMAKALVYRAVLAVVVLVVLAVLALLGKEMLVEAGQTIPPIMVAVAVAVLLP